MNVQKKIVCVLWKCFGFLYFWFGNASKSESFWFGNVSKKTDILVWKCLFLACFAWILENKLYLCTMFLMHLISESYLSI